MIPRPWRYLAAAGWTLILVGNCAGPTASPSDTALSSPTPTPPIESATPSASSVPSATASPSPSPTNAFDPTRVNLSLVKVAGGLAAPLFVTGAGDGTGRLFVLEQAGRIRIIGADGKLRTAPFLDISSRVMSGGELGLLGLAFHPDYLQNGRFFLDYSATNGDTIISEWARRDADHADPASERILFRIPDPYPNHNGGMLAFGPDGLLYSGLGDGGSGGDPLNNGQRLDTLWGKLLRVDVNGTARPYLIPHDNPFVGRAGVRPEILAYGLRNPWRFSFDRSTDDLFIADVGQGAWEEVDAVRAGHAGGLNFGWRIMEGRACFVTKGCDQSGLTLPAVVYGHDSGCSITGGYVYRGSAFPALAGGYFFGDYCSGLIWGANAAAMVQGPANAKVLLHSGLSISSFGQDDAGELYVCDLSGGAVYRLTGEVR